MDKLVKLIFCILGGCYHRDNNCCNRFKSLAFDVSSAIFIIGIATTIVNYEDKRMAGKKITDDKPNKEVSFEKGNECLENNEEISKTAPDIIKTNEENENLHLN